MSNDNLLSLNLHVLKKDMELLAQALTKQNIALQIENEMLKSKLEHLEELLKNIESIPIIGG